jgi:hypothetical protein
MLVPMDQTKELSKDEAWYGMPKELLEYIKSLPEFDAEIFFEITGIRVNKKKITIKIDVDKARELGLI